MGATGVTNLPSPGFPTILPSTITVLPLNIVPNWHPFNFPPMVRRPANFRVSRLVADDCFLIHVDDYHVAVGARLDGPFSRVHAEDASGIVRRNAHESIER